jgi:hypothetical protein
MRKAPTRNWSTGDLTAPLVSDPTPFASIGLLLAADGFPLAVSLMPYAGCAHSYNGNKSNYLPGGARFRRYWAQVIAPGSRHARMAVSTARQIGAQYLAGSKLTMKAWTETGGTTGSNVVLLYDVGNNGFFVGDAVFDDQGMTQILMTDAGIDDFPDAPTGRQFELQAQLTPYVEDCYIEYSAGVSLVVTDRPDIDTL